MCTVVMLAALLAGTEPARTQAGNGGCRDGGTRSAVLIQGFDYPREAGPAGDSFVFQYEISAWRRLLERALGFPAEAVLWLPLDKTERASSSRSAPAREALGAAQRFLTAGAKGPCDLALLLYAGHGRRHGVAWRYKTPEAVTGWMRWSGLPGNAEEDGDFLALLRGIQGAGRAIAVVQSCFSGALIAPATQAWNGESRLSLYTATDADERCRYLGSYETADGERMVHVGGLYFQQMRGYLARQAAAGRLDLNRDGKLDAGEIETAFDAAHEAAAAYLDGLPEYGQAPRKKLLRR